jgi:hypothetical protein
MLKKMSRTKAEEIFMATHTLSVKYSIVGAAFSSPERNRILEHLSQTPNSLDLDQQRPS